ncbi:hypothetical protein ACFL2V_12165 [Pseudomonadota bacterium]
MSVKTRIKSALGLLVVAGALSFNAMAANDPNIKGDLRTNIQHSMTQFIDQQSDDGSMFVYDAVKGKLLKLKLAELHEGIVKKGDFYVSCADFHDQAGRKIDIDFMVRPIGGDLITTQALVHSIDGKKRKYHLEKL